MKLLILVFSDADVDAFESRQLAEREMEAIDVRNGIYRAFDAEGRELKIEVVVEARIRPRIFTFLSRIFEVEQVRIVEHPAGSPEPAVLLELLREYGLRGGRSSEEMIGRTLDELIAHIPVHTKSSR